MKGKGAGRRAVLLDAACGYVAGHGIANLSLRPLAASLGTSDRMLLYYFGSRSGLIAAILERTSGQLRELLATALPAQPVPPAALLGHALSAMPDEHAQAALRLWLEVAALAARGEQPYAATAQAVIGDWAAWIADRLDLPEQQRDAASTALLAIIDGLVVTSLAGGLDGSAAAAWLGRQLAPVKGSD